jgi:coenzyme F420-0:L-glutamate ligase/coenzyme F420-1:gamma-L-glutamate ligase
MPGEPVRIWGLEGIPEVRAGDRLAALIVDALGRRRPPARLAAGTILVVAQKVVSKAEGRVVALDAVEPSPEAARWAERFGKDARLVEVVLRQARRVVRMERGILIVETHHGFVCANGGVDTSNAPEGAVVLLPDDPDASAARLRQELEEALGVTLAVIVSDTFGRPWRQGLTNVALGVAGLAPFVDYRGQVDSHGRTLQATVLAIADELAAAAELVMGKVSAIPVAAVEGYAFPAAAGSGRALIRPPSEDLFR